MAKIIFLTITLFIFNILNVSAQDTLNIKGRHYQFIQAPSDTVKSNGNAYIIKYVVEPEEAEGMRSNGKIYVVVTVLATIFAGLFVYLLYLDRKVGRLEKEQKS